MSKKKDEKSLKIKRSINVGFVISVAAILIISIGIFIGLSFILKETGFIKIDNFEESSWFLFLVFSLSSLIIGLGLAFLCRKIILDPINELLNGLSKLSEGEYDTRLEIGKYKATNQLNERFNNLASELENKEIFSSDFINNFSHELKTPIVSIKGLVELLINKDISPEKQKEYLKIIDEETERLSIMTTNILNLTKYESQEIVSDVTSFNLSEQIRTCILLLERKWSEKKLNLSIEFDEFNIKANEDMLKQVWINLIDNAIKFSYDETDLIITIKKVKKTIVVKITNHGVSISKDNIEKIYQKFYQVDKSRTKEGNGIGLSIVKRIIDLHKGEIKVESDDDITTFTVILNA